MTPQELQFLFTLRYNPLKKVNFKPRPVQDFLPEITDLSSLEYILSRSLLRLIKDKRRIAISYSSGVDSNVVLGLLLKLTKQYSLSPKIACFCMRGAETEAAREIAYKNDVPFFTVEPESVFENISKYVAMVDEPRWNVYPHLIAKEAKSHGTELLLSGDGADELFGGYIFRYKKFLENEQSCFGHRYLLGHHNDYFDDMQHFFKSLMDWGLIYDYLNQFNSSFLDEMEKVFYADFNGKLIYDFIPTSRAISRYYGIEVKSPFLDEAVIDYALSIPWKAKIDTKRWIGKLPLRHLLKQYNINVSDEKMGFTYDLVKDWREHRGQTIEMHPKTFDTVNYDWFEKNQGNMTDYRIINKVYQTICLSEYLKLHD